ncbi:ArdC family protein [Acidithiobacillus thiooxidans]|nr:zincin-like metallopeptidase domain-containing protein [Acidithiobacillus thiooxidans]
MATTKNEMLDALLQRMDDALANGKRLPWQKPWEPKFGDLSAPHNPATERLYSPLNGLILSTSALEHGYEDPRWMGFNQAKEQGWSVRRGEHAAARIFSPIVKKEVDPKTGLEEPRVVAYRSTPLFNAAQIDGIPPMREIPEHERLPKTAELDAIARQMGVAILHSGSGAFYSPGQDRIQLPARNTFADQHGYDATKAHELSHATGHESRLDRDSLRQYTSIKGRAAEEMTAEIGSYLLSTRLGVPFMGNNPDMTDAQHAAYLTTWAKDLSPDERRAAIEQGIKAAGHLEKQLGLARENGLVMEIVVAKERQPLSIDGPKVQPENASVSTTPAEWRAWKDRELVSALERLGGYPAVLADPEKSLELQDMLDSALGERGIDIRNSLCGSGDWGSGSLGELVSDDAVLTTHATRVGAGSNMTQLHWHITMPELNPGGKPRIIDDLLDRSADDMAAHITEQAMKMQRAHWRRLDVFPQKEVADRVSLLPEGKVAPAEIQRGDHLVYRDGPGCIEDGFASAAHGSQITVIPMDRDKNGAISTWLMDPKTVQQGQIIKHAESVSMESINTLTAVNQRLSVEAFDAVRRTAYKSLSKSAFVEMTVAQMNKDKPEIDKRNAERASQQVAANARNEISEQKRLAGIHAEQESRVAEKESRFTEAFDGNQHALKDDKAYPMNPGDYVSYIAPSGRSINCIVRDKAALPSDPAQRSEVIYQRVERGGLSGNGKYELGQTVAGDISKSSIREHIPDFLPERSTISKTNSSLLDNKLDARMEAKLASRDSMPVSKPRRTSPSRKTTGIER